MAGSFNQNLLDSIGGDYPVEMKENHDGDGFSLDRRSYLALAGGLAVSAAGCIGEIADGSTTTAPLAAYGYGGSPRVMLDQASVVTASSSEVEPNDNSANATPIEPGVDVTGELESGDVDWFAADLQGGDEIEVRFERDNATGVSAVVFHDPDGQLLGLKFVGSDAPVSVPGHAEEAGTYLIEVADVENGDGPYVLTVMSPGQTDTPTETASPTPSPTPTDTPTLTPTETPTDTPTKIDYGLQGYGEYGYGGVTV